MEYSEQMVIRGACLKLAQSAETLSLGGSRPPQTVDVLDRADEYAAFVNGTDEAMAVDEVAALDAYDAYDDYEAYAAKVEGKDEDEVLTSGVSQPVTTFGFGWALLSLKEDEKVARIGWNGKGMWLGLQVPDAGSMNTLPYIYMITVQGDRVPWLASQTDLLAEDWFVV